MTLRCWPRTLYYVRTRWHYRTIERAHGITGDQE